MLRKIKLFFLLAIVFVLAFPLNACQRLEGKIEDVIVEEEGKKDTKKDEEEPVEPKKPEEKDALLIPFAKNNGFDATYGYMDKSGNVLIEPRFKQADLFYESGVAVVTDSNDKVGLIDKNGEYLIEPKWDYLYYNDEMFFGYQYERNISAGFDPNGKQLFQRDSYIGDFSEGYAVVYGEGYIDRTGKPALILKYELLTPFVNGIAEVAKDYLSPSYYIDKQGNDLTEKVSSGLMMYRDEDTGLFGFKNMQGDIVIKAEYYEASPFLNGYAFVNAASDSYNGLYGIIDTAGNQVLEPKYCGIMRMNNGLIAVGEEIQPDGYNSYMYFEFCKKALYTADLKKSTDFIYNLVENLDNDNVCVNDDNSVFFLNSNLEQSDELPKFSGRGYSIIRDGKVLRGYINNRLTVLDTKGNIIAKDSGDIDLGGGIISKNQVAQSLPVENINYPVLSGMKDSSLQEKINDTIFMEMVKSYEDFARLNGPEDSSYINSYYTITKEKDLVLIDQSIDTYVFGGVHGYYFRNTLYIDAVTGKVYTLGDLFKPDSGVWDYLSNAISAKLNENMDEMGYFDNSIKITADNKLALKKDGLVIYFAEGDIASYAAGMQEFEFTFSELSEYIDKQGEFWTSFN
ncbi:MAG: WG repeat-containing protein [Acetivibrionales bacterium]|jgi:hypothetical protein|nr:DUF3298 domain-containing protein [Clostridiaceae bacterium]